MKVLLTGYDGFVGTFFQKVTPCVPLRDAQGRVDLRDENRVMSVVKSIKPEFVVHLAAQSFVPESFANPKETYDINFTGTLNLLNALKETGFQGRVLYISSGDTYGLVSSDSLPIKESQPLKPRSPYSVSKVAAEALCYQWSQSEKFEIVSARPFNHIGAGQSERFVISNFAKQIIEIKLGKRDAVLHVGDIDVSRDFTDVRDIVKAYFLLLHKGRNGESYNICSGVERTIRSLINIMQGLAKVDAEIHLDNSRLRLFEQRRVEGDFSKLKKDTGWSPSISIEKTLEDILDYWEKILS